MKTIAFMSQKGGSGKTTLAVHTAVAAQEAGERVVIIDTDPQKSASVWGQERTAQVPIVVAVNALEIKHVLAAAATDRMTLAIVDTAPHATAGASQIAQSANLVLIPCRPSAFDIAAVKNVLSIVESAKTRAAFILSACPLRAPEIPETRMLLAGYRLPVAPCEVGERRAFSRAVATGRAVTEFDGEGKSAEEIRALWAWTEERL